jgi:ribosomal protein L37AE/L43A
MLGNDWNAKQIRKALIEDYPYLHPRDMHGNLVEDYDFDYLEGELDLPEGWLDLFLQCCEDLKEPLEKAGLLYSFKFLQIKEKFGAMRIYAPSPTEEVRDILAKYEFISRQVCCVCGKPATTTTKGWTCPYCDEHFEEVQARGEEKLESINIQTSYVLRRFADGAFNEEVVDCSNEWERYLKNI